MDEPQAPNPAPIPPTFVSPIDLTTGGRDLKVSERQRKERRKRRILWSSIILIPFLVMLGYWLFFASPRYTATAQFTLKSDGQTAAPNLGLLSMALGGSQTLGDGFTEGAILAYIPSSEGLQALDNRLHLRQHFSDQRWDVFSRLRLQTPREESERYLRANLQIHHDLISNLIIVKARAFTPEFAQQFARATAEEAETLVNRLNADLVNKRLDHQRTELAQITKRFEDAKQALLAFQCKHRLLDASGTTKAIGTLIADLEGRLAAERVALAEMRSVQGQHAESVVRQEARLAAISKEVQTEMQRILGDTGKGDLSAGINALVMEEQQLRLHVDFIAEAYKGATIAFEQTAQEVQRKQRHLVMVANPTLPEEASHPQIWYNALTLLVVLVLTAGIVHVILSIIYEHRD